MAATFTGFSDSDANGVLNTWLAGASSVAPSNWYVGLLLTLPTSSVGAGLVEPWLPAPVISTITSVSTGGTINGGTNRFYQITAVNASGETTASAEVEYAVPAGTNTNVVTVSWGAVSGAATYNPYEGSTTGSEGLLTTGVATTYFQDTGADSPGASPPSTNGSGYAYARVEVAANATNFPVASSRLITNGTAITFPVPTASWGVINGFALFDGAQVSANFRACGALNNPQQVIAGSAPYFALGTLPFPFLP
jgi:hypothetical protein